MIQKYGGEGVNRVIRKNSIMGMGDSNLNGLDVGLYNIGGSKMDRQDTTKPIYQVKYC